MQGSPWYTGHSSGENGGHSLVSPDQAWMDSRRLLLGKIIWTMGRL